VSIPDMAARFEAVLACGLPWLVLDVDSAVAGYAYAGRWDERPACRRTVETAIYLDPACTGKGLGSLLYGTLLDELRARGMHVVIGGIALPNEPSTRLHAAFGFREAARFTGVAEKFGRAIDVGYWELRLGAG
jgi:L-amino acid N-acyltransferase YncA